jgi:ribonuclease P protein component
MRLGGRGVFRPIYEAKAKIARGPLVAYAKPNDAGVPRLGVSVRRDVGNAARRNRIKRLLRESFRLMQHDWPAAYDLVVVVRPHVPLTLAEYQKLMAMFRTQSHARWAGRNP